MAENVEFLFEDNGTIRDCDSNIAKMNMWQAILHLTFRRRYFQKLWYSFWELTKGLFLALPVFIALPLSPIIMPIVAWKMRRNAQIEVEKENKRKYASNIK